MAEKIFELKADNTVGFSLLSHSRYLIKSQQSRTVLTTLWVVFPQGYLGRADPGPIFNKYPGAQVELDLTLEDIRYGINVIVTNNGSSDMKIKEGDHVANLVWYKKLETKPKSEESDLSSQAAGTSKSFYQPNP